jgi:hypothetical protein
MFSVLLFAAFAIDTAIWFVHHRHLQTEADSAALAGAEAYQFPCSTGVTTPGTVDNQIATWVHKYDGTTVASGGYNQQVSVTPTPATPPGSGHNLFSLVNNNTFANQTTPPDTGLQGSPCKDSAVDVKLTESGLLSFFPFVNPGPINAQARVSIEQETSQTNLSAFAAELAPPTKVQVTLISENGANVGNALVGPLTLNPSNSNPYSFSLGTTLPSSVPTGLYGMQVALTGTGSTDTYDNAATHPPYGIAYTRIWTPPGSITNTTAPWAGDIWLAPTVNSAGLPETCQNTPAANSPSNFSSSSTNTSVYLCANLSFPTLPATPPCSDVPSVTFTEGTTTGVALTCPAGNADGTWQSAAISLAPDANATLFTLTGWKLTAGNKPGGGGTCSSSSACTGNFPATSTTEAFTGAYDQSTSQTSNSGEIIGASLTDTTSGNDLTSISQTQAQTSGTNGGPENVTVGINLLQLQDETSITSNTLAAQLSFGQNQQNLAVDCAANGGGTPTEISSIASGCPGPYTIINTLTEDPAACSASLTYCIGQEVTGQKTVANLTQGMNDRVYCAGVTTGACDTTENGPKPVCSNPNYWSTSNSSLAAVLSQLPPDPRLLTLPITGLGDESNGAHYLPIYGFAEFYATGWAGDPCLSTGNHGVGTSGGPNAAGLSWTTDVDPPGDNFKNCNQNPGCGILMGHFVKFVETSPTSTGSGTCTTNTFGNCIAILTK